MERDPIRYQIGDLVKTRKEHPCGSIYWEITRTGMDFGLKCCYCGHHVMIPRRVFEHSVRSIATSEEVAAQKEELERKARNRPRNLQRRPARQPAGGAEGPRPARGALGRSGRPPQSAPARFAHPAPARPASPARPAPPARTTASPAGSAAPAPPVPGVTTKPPRGEDKPSDDK